MLAGETYGCFLNSYRCVNVQAEVATTAITQLNHGRYHAMEQHLGYASAASRVAAALTSPEIRQNVCDILDAEDLVKLLNPLKTATSGLCEETSPTVSLIVPLKSMIEQSMTPNDGDSTTVADARRAVLSNILGRYSRDAYNYLLETQSHTQGLYRS